MILLPLIALWGARWVDRTTTSPRPREALRRRLSPPAPPPPPSSSSWTEEVSTVTSSVGVVRTAVERAALADALVLVDLEVLETELAAELGGTSLISSAMGLSSWMLWG